MFSLLVETQTESVLLTEKPPKGYYVHHPTLPGSMQQSGMESDRWTFPQQ